MMVQSNPAVSKALLTYAAEKGHSRAPEYMYNLNLLESLQMNPLMIDSEDLQLLEQIDAMPPKEAKPALLKVQQIGSYA